MRYTDLRTQHKVIDCVKLLSVVKWFGTKSDWSYEPVGCSFDDINVTCKLGANRIARLLRFLKANNVIEVDSSTKKLSYSLRQEVALAADFLLTPLFSDEDVTELDSETIDSYRIMLEVADGSLEVDHPNYVEGMGIIEFNA